MARKYIVEFNIREELHKHKLNISPGFFTKLESEVKKLVAGAAKRAVENHRTTVMERDVGY